ncbi:MAG: zinc transporter ZupT [Elusimicrobia bacterium]|nr:zinc transporter ZupT [Elusimicrobiota bacterium]
MEHGGFAFALLLTTLAGLATGIGSAIAFFARRTNVRFMSATLGFSAGVMIFASLTDLLPEAQRSLSAALGARAGSWAALASFCGGIILAGIIDRLVPSFENPHEPHKVEEMGAEKPELDRKMLRMGLLSSLALSLHNFPEGFATFIAALTDPATGISVAVAIAFHNVPEGISVSVPIFYATGSRRKAFWYSFLTGFCEPLGALLGYWAFGDYFQGPAFGVPLAAVAGIMIYISFDELLPAVHESGEHHAGIYGLLAGMALVGACIRLTH